jgi:hypothetical protein
MAGERSRYGLTVSALGAVALAVSVFLPWYGVSFTAAGVAMVQQLGQQFVSEFGNASLQSYLGDFHASVGSLAGHEVTAISAHQVLKDLNVILLIIAGLALIDALLPLARSGSALPDGAGGAVALLGCVSAVCVIYRMVHPPTPPGEVIALSLREGAWLALLGSLAMIGGGLWRARVPSIAPTDASVRGAWSGLSGWTPES